MVISLKPNGRFFNQNVQPLTHHIHKQYWYMYGLNTTNRYSSNFLNERENFFHKPLVNLNHFLELNDKQDCHQYSIGVVVLVEHELTEVFQEFLQLKEKDV